MSQKSLKCHVYNFNAYAAPQAGKSFKVSSPAKVSILQQNCQNHFFATFINVDWGPYPIFVTCNICGAGVIFFSWSQRVKNECVFDVFWCRKSSFGVFFVYNFELKNVQWKWCWCEQNDKYQTCLPMPPPRSLGNWALLPSATSTSVKTLKSFQNLIPLPQLLYRSTRQWEHKFNEEI